MRIHYGKKQDAVYIRFSGTPYHESEEVRRGVILDYDKKGEIIGIEILDVSRRLSANFLSSLRERRVPLEVT